MQAIQTRYFGPTDSKGSRLQAKCAAKTMYVPYDHALDIDENHDAAARTLAASLEWTGELVSGTLADGSFVHVFARRGKS